MGNRSVKDESMPSEGRSTSYVRSAHHAGSWYQDNSEDLAATLEKFMAVANLPTETVEALSSSRTTTGSEAGSEVGGSFSLTLRGIVCPHAGYRYSGPTAAYSYRALRHELASPSCNVRTIVVLHPSHHVYLNGCAVSGASVVETPVGNLMIDSALREEILKTGKMRQSPKFSVMSQTDDEHEHSGEMQYPYIAYILHSLGLLESVRILPIMCGALSVEQEKSFGKSLTSILDREEVLTVISTDFCHWGSRFRYNPTPVSSSASSNGKPQPIHEFIEQLDRRGMDLIAAQTPGAFAEYLKQTHNTICGRHAVAVWLRAIECASTNESSSSLEISFVKYAQSMAATSMRDSSVSYAAALATTRSVGA